ncbi:MAG: AraC family transcriptional regulator [Myxococcota bacterium]
MLEAIAKRGGSVASVLRKAGLRQRDLADPEHFVDLEKMLVLQDEAAREVGDDTLGLTLALTYNPSRLGVLAYALFNAPTVGVALHNLERYAHTLLHGVRVVIEMRGSECVSGYDIPVGDRELRRQNAEGASVVAFEVMRRLIGPDWRPKRVEFGHRRPADTTQHSRVFGAPLRFEAEHSFALVYDRSDVDRAVQGADAGILPIVQRYLDELPAPAARSDAWPREVRALIARDICNGHPDMERIARALGLSGRTLQRRLAERGLVWKTMVEEVRRELALRYLKDVSTSLTEVAFLLGYSDLSAFGRAFRRWTGTTPAAQRRRLRSEASGAATVV